jgi:SAM-dependent methyltransferase
MTAPRPASDPVPAWAWELLRSPHTFEPLHPAGDRLVLSDGREVGRVEAGIVRMPIATPDDNIGIYKSLGGAHFWERAAVPFAMSTLDTPVYHGYLDDVRPGAKDAVIVDIGGGDGRNARPWLDQGFLRVVVVDVVADALLRFRARLAADNPDWLDRVLLIEADARSLPLTDGCAAAVLAIESLYYLREDYELGLRECVRILGRSGKILLSERDWEGGLLLRLLYDGLGAMLEAGGSRTIVDAVGSAEMRSRCFDEDELVGLLSRHGLTVRSVRGTSLLAMVLGWMRNKTLLGANDAAQLDAAQALLVELGRFGRIRRCHVALAERAA